MTFPHWYTDAARQHGPQILREGLGARRTAKLLGYTKSTASLFLNWLRAHPEAAQVAPGEVAEVPMQGPPRESQRKLTWEEGGLICTDLGPDYGVVRLTPEQMRSFRRDYSRLWGGRAVNQSEMAIRYGFPSAHAVDVFKRVHGLRQTSIPHDDQEIEVLGVEGAVEETIGANRQEYMLRLQERTREEEKRNAGRWLALEASIQQTIAALTVPALPTVEAFPAERAVTPYALVLGLTDLHLGKLAYDVFGRRAYDRATAVRRALAAVQLLLAKAIRQHGTPSRVYLMLGSDNLHVDNLDLMTTRGTMQGAQSDGDFPQMAEDYVALMQRVIAIILAVAPVEVVEIEGNHDRASTMWLGMIIRESLRGNPRASYTRERGGLSLLNYGRNSLMFLHGDQYRLADTPRLAIVAARERGLALESHILTFSGDKHHEATKDLGGVKAHILPALCPPDSWHRTGKWIGAAEECLAFVIRERGGKEAVLYVDSEELDAARG